MVTPPTIPDPAPRIFKILSIDGGGIKGLYTAAAMAELERVLAERHRARNAPGEPPKLNRYFDLIAGTSTGAIIAVALACGKPASEILTLYRTLGPKVFPDTRWLFSWARTLRQLFLGSRYSADTLAAELETFLGDRRFSDAQNYLALPVTNLQNYTPRIFKTRHSENYFDNNDLLRKIVLASASAPTYFPLCPAPDIEGNFYADGGLYANNPSLVALIESLRVFVGPHSQRKNFDEVWLLSLGNYPSPQGFRTSWFSLGRAVSPNKSALGWMAPQKDNNPLLGVLMDAQAASAISSVKILRECLPPFKRYHRSDARSKLPENTPDSELPKFLLADAAPTALTNLEAYGKRDGQADANDPKVISFFETTTALPTFFY